MKKILTLLTTMALTATASTNVIACKKRKEDDTQFPFILDPNTGNPIPDKNGNPIPNPNYQPENNIKIG